MRTAFIKQLHKLAADDARVSLVVGDLGYSVVEEFAAAFPDRFLNAGVAEQNMTGVAAGMAMGGGYTMFTYSIANFSTMRCLEQIRNDVCYHRANVKVVVVGGGVAYGTHGYTHFAVEDVAVMRALPGMVVAVPADPAESAALTLMAAATPGPWYLRLGRNGEPPLHKKPLPAIAVGDLLPVRQGRAGLVFASGPIAYEALLAAEMVAAEKIDVAVWSVPFIKPLDVARVVELARTARWIVCAEEHGPVGGLCSALAEALWPARLDVPIVKLHFPEWIEKSGSQTYLRREAGLDAAAMAETFRGLAAQSCT